MIEQINTEFRVNLDKVTIYYKQIRGGMEMEEVKAKEIKNQILRGKREIVDVTVRGNLNLREILLENLLFQKVIFKGYVDLGRMHCKGNLIFRESSIDRFLDCEEMIAGGDVVIEKTKIGDFLYLGGARLEKDLYILDTKIKGFIYLNTKRGPRQIFTNNEKIIELSRWIPSLPVVKNSSFIEQKCSIFIY